ncbi:BRASSINOSTEROID INSENSITIVE 1-associated receptor kinase 1-like [Malus sylvestris]|uniref:BRASSINOSTEROID INSENSITIVE 1-associated receptor kinase 1-like n=1 Tax=Malus sylvestris TaxID=3752 RepID=UPI0021AC1D52|nr:BRASSINOSTEROID INSENSITIVE 1-associated receptor kinase 1-like [Malus sylvestris]
MTGNIPEELGGLSDLSLCRMHIIYSMIPGFKIHKKGTSSHCKSCEFHTLSSQDLSNNNLTGDIPVNGSFSLFTPISKREERVI